MDSNKSKPYVSREWRERTAGWESRISKDPHDPTCAPDEVFTFSVQRGGGKESLAIIVAGVSEALANAIESTLTTLEALLAEAAGEGPQ